MEILENEISELDAVEEQEHQEVQKEQEAELPEFYQNKTPAQLAKMHQEAQKVIDRQGIEVGEVRKLADELLRSQLTINEPKEQPKEVDFFENPQEAIRQAVNNNPKIIAAEKYGVQMQKDYAKQTINQRHPDTSTLVQDPEFQSWVQSSAIRQELYARADSYDVNAADELFSTYKQIRTVKQSHDVNAEKQTRDKSLQSASVDAGGSGEQGRKIFRSSALKLLQIRDPQKYRAMEDEIFQAYAEDRVR